MQTIDADADFFAELDALLSSAPPPASEAPGHAAAAEGPAAETAVLLEPPVTLEVFQEAPPAPAPVKEEAPAGRPQPMAALKTVLVVDDNQDYRDMVKYLLEANKYSVMTASNGAEGLALACDRRPDLMVADFNMPQMNGFELIQSLRSRDETRRIPIVVMTGASNRAQLKELFGGDISRFLEKPMTNEALLGAVWESLEKGPVPTPAGELVAAKAAATEKIYTAAPKPAAVEEPAAQGAAPAPAPVSVSLETIEEAKFDAKFMDMVQVEEAKSPEKDEQGLDGIANDSPLISMVNKILVQGVAMRASDIHIEPQEKNVAVRVRMDGTLQNLCSLPAYLAPKLAARVKIMANLVITERRLPQDGMFKATIKGHKIEFRVSTLPCIHGEKIVMRILGGSKLKGDLASLGLSSRDRQAVEKAVASPHGLILVTGPTGSGKTTTLYTMINVLNTPDVNIMTAEDPVEYQLPGISQAQVKASIGMTFEAVLRSFLRQDPDVMLVGEIRDLETAEIAVKASVTGHLVLSTLHTNSAPATITRLTHMGLAPYLVAASVRLVVAQRLVKVLCPSCKAGGALAEEDQKFLTAEEAARLATVHRPAGCAKCRQTGYAGRKPIFEVMPLQSAEMRQLILDCAGADRLGTLAVQEGMVSLRQAALNAVADGTTSLEEALSIILSE